MEAGLDYVGLGIYSVREAARLTEVSPERITRWVRGYKHGQKKARRFSQRIWNSDLPEIPGSLALSFRDLMEVRFVDAFRKAGVSWMTLRAAHRAACDVFKSNHPFSTNRFRTDGKRIFLELAENPSDAGIIEIRSRQGYFEKIVREMFKDIELVDDELLRWWPLGRDRHVLLDPERSLGAPIVREGVPTRAIAAAGAKNTPEEISRWYEISISSVDDAIAFERRKPAA